MVSTVKSRPNHYDVLGLSASASSDQIKAAFARKMSLFGVHPLAAGPQICAAYETLRDPDKRRAYDRSIGLSPAPKPLQWSIAAPRWGDRPLAGPDLTVRPRPAHLGSLPLATRSPDPEPQAEPRTAPFIAAALRDLAAPGIYEPSPATSSQPAPVRRPEAPAEPVRQREARAEPAPQAQPREGLPPSIAEEDFAHAEEGAVHWKRPAVAVGALVLGVGLFGAWAGWEAGNDVTAAPTEEAVTLAVPPAKAEAATSAALSPPEPRVARAQPDLRVRPTTPAVATVAAAPAERRPMPEELSPSEERALAGQAEALEAEQSQPEQVAPAPAFADASAAAAAAAKLPLPNSVVARTIHRIGYSCGQVASTTAIEGGAPGVFKVTCTSGHSYRAQPVRGRYRFRRLAGQ